MRLVYLHFVCILLCSSYSLEAQVLEIPREIDQYVAKGIKLCGPVSHSAYKVNDRLRNQCPNLAKWLMASSICPFILLAVERWVSLWYGGRPTSRK